MGYKTIYESCKPCKGSGTKEYWGDVTSRMEKGICTNCAGSGKVSTDVWVDEKIKNTKTKHPIKDSENDDWTSSIGVLAFVAISLYLYFFEKMDIFESLLIGAVLGIIIKYAIKYLLILGALYLGYELLQNS